MILLVLVLLVLSTSAEISINITVNSKKNDILIKYAGNDKKDVTDVELKLFNVTTQKLKRGIRVELGKVPNDVYLQDSTDNGNLFQQFGWEPVKRSIKVHKAQVIDIINENVVLKTHEYINNSSLHIKSERLLYQLIENTAQSLWYNDGYPDDNAFYVLRFNFTYGHFRYKNKWRSNETYGERMSFGVTKKGNLIIKPYQTVITNLIATKIILVIEIVYKTELVGSTIANYVQLYGKHHFWAPSMQDIMRAAGLKNEIITREEIEVRCFMDPRLQETVKSVEEINKTYRPKGKRKKKN